MKKFFAIILALAMVLTLCGCDSADYKEATELYNDGEYAAARAIFAELEDYKDSADMVLLCDYDLAVEYMDDGEYDKAQPLLESLGDYEDSAELLQECEYQLALACMDAGEYAEAREMFLSFGDYQDSADKAVVAARYMLLTYLESTEGITKIDTAGVSGSIITAKEGDIWGVYVYTMSGALNIDLSIGFEITPADGSAVMLGTDSTYTSSAYYDAEASSEWDISTYVNGDAMAWEYFNVSGKTAYGTAYTQDSTMLNIMLTSAMNKTTAHLAEVLEDSGLGLTMADIGFEAY